MTSTQITATQQEQAQLEAQTLELYEPFLRHVAAHPQDTAAVQLHRRAHEQYLLSAFGDLHRARPACMTDCTSLLCLQASCIPVIYPRRVILAWLLLLASILYPSAAQHGNGTAPSHAAAKRSHHIHVCAVRVGAQA